MIIFPFILLLTLFCFSCSYFFTWIQLLKAIHFDTFIYSYFFKRLGVSIQLLRKIVELSTVDRVKCITFTDTQVKLTTMSYLA